MNRYFTWAFGVILTFLLIYDFQKIDLNTPLFSEVKLNFPLLILSVFLMPLNWGLESLRWKLILQTIFEISWLQSIKSILVGTALGFITPARIGDYAGRVLYFPPEYRVPSLACIFFNSLIQNSIHIAGGIIFSIFFIELYWPDFISRDGVNAWLFVLLFIGFSGIYLFPYIFSLLIKALKSSRYKKWTDQFGFIQMVSPTMITKIVLLSSGRYIVYFIQYLLILESLGVSVSWDNLSAGVAFIYILQSGIPLPPVLGFLGRTEIAILVWGQFHIAPSIAILATVILWSINLVIPSLTGYLLILTNKVNKNK